jgi:plasmid maintenance system antidote protein VapI
MYDPGLFLDRLLSQLHLADDSQLARTLKMNKKVLISIRERRQPISGSMLMRMQEVTGLTVEELRHMLKDRRKTSRMTGPLKRYA